MQSGRIVSYFIRLEHPLLFIHKHQIMNRFYYEAPQLEILQILLEKGFASSPWDDPAYDDFDLERGEGDSEFA